MRGLYASKETPTTSVQSDRNENVLGALLTGQGLDDPRNTQREETEALGAADMGENADDDNLRQKALVNLRDRRMRLK
jgi:hypothetical protein